MNNTKNFHPTFEDCLIRLSNGTASIDECQAHYPEYAEELNLLLQTTLFLNRGNDVMHSDTFNAYTRFVMVQHIRSQARRQSRSVGFSWRMALTFAMLIGALIVTGTVHAQSVLPGDFYYRWKLTSESAWRALTPDPVAADIALANRRLNEWIAVANNPELSPGAANSYQQALSKLEFADDAKTLSLIEPVLRSHQQLLRDVNLPISGVDINGGSNGH